MASPKSVFVSPGLWTCQMLSTERAIIISGKGDKDLGGGGERNQEHSDRGLKEIR